MKIIFSRSRQEAGSTVLLAIVLFGLIGFLLIAYLTLIGAQNTTTMRSQAWNATIPVVEAGLEDALTHLNVHGSTNLLCDGWAFQSNCYVMTRWVGSANFYTATISNYPSSPVI